MGEQKKLVIGAVITMAMFLSGAYYISLDDDAYYCEARDLVMICEKLSSGLGTRCYYSETYKICSEGWVNLEMGQLIGNDIPPPETILIAGSKWKCSPESCVKIK